MQIQELVKQCVKENREAQHELYTFLSPVIYGVCQRYATNNYQADDIFQDAFIRIFQKIAQWDSDKGSIEGWSTRITVNIALAQFRDKHLKASEDIEDKSEIISDNRSVENDMTYEEMLGIVNELPDKQKIVFNMFVVEGYSHKEIAELLKIDEGTSRSQLNKARKQLQNKFLTINSFE